MNNRYPYLYGGLEGVYDDNSNYYPYGGYSARPAHEFVRLDRQYVDVTGDRMPDQISLVGQNFSPVTVYYKQLYVEVVDGATHKPTMITLRGGYHPKMRFCDFNGDRVADIYVSAETGGSGGTSDYYIYTDINNNPVPLPVPQPLTITGGFQDRYRVSISIKEQNKTYTLDLSDRKHRYDQAGYYQNGKLVTPTNVLPNAYSVLRPVDTDHDGVCELYGVQRISGFYNADTIAYVTSLWKWHRNQWILTGAAVQKAM